jgi:hypothetical protein
MFQPPPTILYPIPFSTKFGTITVTAFHLTGDLQPPLEVFARLVQAAHAQKSRPAPGKFAPHARQVRFPSRLDGARGSGNMVSDGV